MHRGETQLTLAGRLAPLTYSIAYMHSGEKKVVGSGWGLLSRPYQEVRSQVVISSDHALYL